MFLSVLRTEHSEVAVSFWVETVNTCTTVVRPCPFKRKLHVYPGALSSAGSATFSRCVNCLVGSGEGARSQTTMHQSTPAGVQPLADSWRIRRFTRLRHLMSGFIMPGSSIAQARDRSIFCVTEHGNQLRVTPLLLLSSLSKIF